MWFNKISSFIQLECSIRTWTAFPYEVLLQIHVTRDNKMSIKKQMTQKYFRPQSMTESDKAVLNRKNSGKSLTKNHVQ